MTAPTNLAAEDTLAIDDVGLGPSGGAVHRGHFLLGIADGQEINAMQFEKAVIGVAVDVDADAQNHNSLVLACGPAWP